MPIYEYRCAACGKELEALQKLSDPPLKQCPACHADALVKLVSAGGFQLKGSGWYATDFKGSGKPAAKKDGGEPAAKKDGGESPAESKAEGKEAASESKSETKSETKTEAKGAATTPSSGSGAPSTPN